MRIIIHIKLFIFILFSLNSQQRVQAFPKWQELVGNRVIGGAPASIGQFPFQVGLKIKTENSDRLGTCGGVLIAEDYVLTAGHCVVITGIEHIEVHLGTVKLIDEGQDRTVVIVPKDNFIPHNWFNAETLSNDIALLKLPQKVALSDTIKPIDLPTYHDAYRLDLEAHNVTASGWGRYSDESWDGSINLQYAQVNVINQRVCRHFYRNLASSMVCTWTGRGQGVCHGDSGGPLIFKDIAKNRTILVGLTSFGNGVSCVGEGWPSVFTRVSSFLDWINYNTDIPIKDN